MNDTIQQVGFPDFWQKAYNVRPAAFRAISNLVPLQEKLFSKPLGDPLHKVIRHIVKVTIKSLGALTTLLLNGLGNDGMNIARRMFEAAVIVRYLRNHPNKLNDYLDYDHILNKKMMDYLDKDDPDLTRNLSPQTRREIENKYESVKARFANRDGRLRNSWNDQHKHKMAEDVGLVRYYQIFYRFASSMHHVDIRGIVSQLDGKDVDLAPSLHWIDEALVVGHTMALIVLEEFNGIAALGFDAEIQAARDAFDAAWKA